MKYKLIFTKKAQKEFSSLDAYVQRKIQVYLDRHVNDNENPRAAGSPLSGELSNYWRYRIGDYRVICEIRDDIFVVIAIKTGHRSKIYR